MSFSNELLKGRYKKNPKKKKQEEDIAPVRKDIETYVPSRSRVDDENAFRMELFNTNPLLFEDGYDIGDISGTILMTAGDSALNFAKGVGRFAEGIGDAVNYGVADIVDKIGDKDLAKALKKETQKSLVDDLTGSATNAFNRYSVAGRTTDAILEGMGQASAIMATGGLGNTLGWSAKGISALTTGATAVSGYGSGMSEAYQGGATDEEAVIYGVISGGAEALTEALFGGMGKGVNALGFSHGLSSADDMLAKKIADKFSSQIVKNFVEFGVKASAEGVEEVLSGIAQAAGKKFTYMSEEDFSKILKDENLLEQFVVGTVTSGFMQSGVIPGTSKGSLKESVKNGTDFITGLDANEQAVVDKVFEDVVAEKEQGGNKLSKKDKSKLYDEVIESLEKGEISIDTIESVLGGETYERYKAAKEKDDALVNAYEELGNKVNPTLKESTRYKELDDLVKEFGQNSQSAKLKAQLGEEVFNLTNGSKLTSSYVEREKRGQTFEADLSKYDEKQREVVQKAVESGVLNNTRRTHEFVDMLAKISADKGVSFDFTNNEKLKNSSFAVEGRTVNGYRDGNTIGVNIDSKKSLRTVVGHEITHILEGTELYGALADAVKQYATTKGEYATRMQSLRELYTGVYKGEDFDAKIQAELIADIIGEYIFTDTDFINKLSTEHRNIFQKIYDEIKYLCKVATAGSKEARELEKVKKTFDKIYRESGKAKAETDGDTQHSLSAEQENFFKDSLSETELQKNYLESKNTQYNISFVEEHKKNLENAYTVDASVDKDTILKRYDKILDIWDRVGVKLDSKFLEDWNNKSDRIFTVFKAQAGYKYNIELSSMCKKGVPLFEAIDTIVKKEVMQELGIKTLGKEEKEILYDILEQHNFEIPCAICYVEQARQREGNIIDAFLNGNEDGKLGWNQVLDSIEAEMKANGVDFRFFSASRDIATEKYNPAKMNLDEETASAFYSAVQKLANEEIKRNNIEAKKKGKKTRSLLTDVTPEGIKKSLGGTLSSNLKIFKVLLTEPSSRFRIDNDLLYSSMATRNLSAMHNALYSLFNSQGGVSGYKTKQGTTIYWGEILKKSWRPDTIRKEGGIRNQSNSDFQMYTLIDQAQMYMDFTAKGYYLQAYTKVLSELKLFGLSKGKINASLIPKVFVYRDSNGEIDVQRTMENAGLDKNGEPIFDDIEGIPHKEAFMLIEDAEYSKNICGICIGYSDNHIRKLLDDNRVQLIIGFHDKTNDPNKRYRGARYSKNYNGLNEAVRKSDGKTIHIGFNTYVKRAEGKFTYNEQTESFEGTTKFKDKVYVADDIPKLAADMYLDMCEKKGYSPAYEDFSTHPNYYKLLADFGLYDSQGHYAPHRKVEYNMPDYVPYLDENGNKKYMSSEEYIEAELQKELVVRDAISEALADTSEDGIIPQFKARVKGKNSVQDSLSMEGDHPTRRFGEIYGDDVRLEKTEDVAPVQEAVAEESMSDIPIDYAPMTEEEANAMVEEQNNIATLTDADAPPIMDAPYYDMSDTTPIDDTTLKGITQRLRETLSLSARETKAIQDVVQKYSTTGLPNREQIFEEIKEEFGEKRWKERNDEIADVKRTLKGFGIKISDAIKSDITDFGEWRKKYQNRLKFSKDGLPVDDIYMSMSTAYPHLFPDDIINPTDQLLRIAEVVDMDRYVVEAEEIDNDIVQEAADIIHDEISKHKEAEQSKAIQEEQSYFYKEVIANDDLAGKREQLNEWYENRKAELHEELDDRNTYVSKRAMGFYNELNNLKKGVKASQELGYFLDFGFKWSELKSTLLQVSKWPGEVIRPGSNVESIVREAIGREYEDRLYDFDDLDTEYQKKLKALENPVKSPIQTVKERLSVKLENTRKELLMNQQLREDSIADFDSEISRLQSEYDSKRDKNTKAANNLLRRIERLQRMKGNVDADYSKRISDLESRIERMESKQYQTAEQRKTKTKEYSEQMAELIGDTSTWKDKKLGISYKVNTLRRNLRDIIRDADGKRDIAKADAIYDELQGKYNHNEAELNREANRIKKAYADMKITNVESTYIQMLGELRHNPDTTLTEDVVKDYYEKHKDKIDTAKVDKAIEMARTTFDELLVRVNQVLTEQGMKEIPYRKGYFPHFTEEKQGFLAKLFNWKTQDNDIPTDIAGLTENFNPNRSWQSFNKQRRGDTTDYNFLKGLDTYVQGSLDWIYHIEDIQKRRAFENHIRYVHSEQGIKDRIDAIYNNEEYDAEEMQEQIDIVLKEAGNPLNNFVTDFRTATNTLAGKKSSVDRSVEEMTNRKFYSTMTNISNRVTGNMVAGSISSALTNFIPITQSWGQVSPISSLRAMSDTIRANFSDDGIVNKSDFLTNRLRRADNLYQTTWDKIGDKASILMDVIDGFTSQTVWRSKYLENISNGMSENEAIKDADQFAENVIAGRSRGNQPTVFDAKNPLVKALTAFQLEVNNQYGYMFKDMPQDMQNESKAKLVKGYATMFIGAYVYNALYSSLTGRNAAFDPIRIIQDLLRDIFGGDDDEEEEIAPSKVIMNFADDIIEELPFVGSMVGGGRMPISSALPYGEGVYEMFKGTLEDIESGDYKTLTNEWLNPLFYLAAPLGGGQLRKSYQGMKMFDKDNAVAGVTGSYTDSGNLRFPVEDTLGNRAKAFVFGQYANKNARKYFDEGYAPLKEKQIEEYAEVELPIADYWKYREGLKDLETLNEKGDYIGGLDLPISKKNILINNIADRETPIDYTDYHKYSNFEEFDFASRYPEKYAVLKEQGISVEDYKENYEESAFRYTDDFAWASDNPEKYVVSKAITNDVMEYRRYTSDLYNIRADKDSNGKSISGSAKRKKKEYIFGLDIDDGAKYILFKSEYKADDTYNHEIINYLDSRDDISWDEMATILEELDFKVDRESRRISW
jgi:hypothetical protein